MVAPGSASTLLSPISSRITACPAGRLPQWWISDRGARRHQHRQRAIGADQLQDHHRPVCRSPRCCSWGRAPAPAPPAGRHDGGDRGARWHQAGQRAAGADRQQDHRRPGRSAATVVQLNARVGTRPASTPAAPTSCRITAGTAGRPRRSRSSSRTPAAGPPARRWRRPDAGSALACTDGRRGGAAGRTSARCWMPHYANATA